MTTNVTSPAPRSGWRLLILIAVPLASFLSFSIQPVVGKFLVPWHGGSASTWIGAMLFFQVALVLGYGWACWLGGRSTAWQVRATVVLAIIAGGVTLLPPPRLLDSAGMSEVLLSLTVAMLPAMILLFSAGLIMQAWLARLHGTVPYFLYSISNVGSLGALLIYPFWVEPHVGLGVQATVWRSLLVLLSLMLCAIALGLRKIPVIAPDADAMAGMETVSGGRKLAWLGLSALTCVCMLGATRHLSAEIGSNPLTWILPLGLYLASFSLAFTGWWREGASLGCAALLAVALAGFTLLKGITANPISGWSAAWLILIVGSGCCLGNGMLYALRPQKQFLHYYLVIGVGGMIGGIFSSLSAPNLFSRDLEFLGAATLLLLAGVVRLMGSPTWLRVGVAAVVVGAPVVAATWIQQQSENTPLRRVHHVRNIYGHLHVIQNPNQVVLRSETTSHGMQLVHSEELRRKPTMYYVESSGVGTTLLRLQETKPRLAVGIVGLGAGTLATYARPEDRFTFWDIDPKVTWVAQTAFSFLKDARGKVLLVEDDGRKGIERSTEAFDLIVIDAFSGDSIPAHLLTREAFELFIARLAPADGLLLIHASNRYADLFPVVAGNAQALGWEALKVVTNVRRPGDGIDVEASLSTYILMHRKEQRSMVDGWFASSDTTGWVSRELVRIHEGDARLIRWTDDRHGILDVLSLERYFRGGK